MTGALAFLGISAQAVATSASAVPACPASVKHDTSPHPNCYLRPWADASTPAIPVIHGSGSVGHVTKFNPLQYRFTVTVKYRVPVKPCPNPTPDSAKPCLLQDSGVLVDVVGRSLPGSKTLAPIPSDALFAIGSTICPLQGPSCTLTYGVSDLLLYGKVALVVSLGTTDFTTNSGNDLRSTGFEFPIVVNVPKGKA